MKIRMTVVFIMMLSLWLIQCGNDDDASSSDTDADTDTDSDIDGDTDTDSDTDTDTDTDGDSELDEYIESMMEEGHLPGLGACVIKGGAIPWCKGYGWANIPEEVPVTEDTPFLIASVSKTVTATALMQIWEEKMYDLDDDINDVLKFPVANPNHPKEPITYRQLFTHTSSIADNWDIMETYFYFYGTDPKISLEDACAGYFTPGGDYYSTNNFLSWAPGAGSEYANMAVALLGHTLEAHTGQGFAEHCDDNIFIPLQMDNTSWYMAPFEELELAMPYWWNGSSYVAEGHYTIADYPDGGLMASARDMARFMLTYAQGGTLDGETILESETIDLILTEQEPGQGLIWALFERDGAAWAGHEGAEIGVATAISFRIEDGLGVVLLFNGDWPSPETPVYNIQDRLIEYAEKL